MGTVSYIIIAAAALFVVWLFFYFVPLGLWISALAAGVPVGPITLIGMRLRKVNPHKVILPMIAAWKAGIKLSIMDLEAHYLAGGTVDRVVRALISADKADIELVFQRAAAIDLADQIGSLEPGKAADIVAMAESPLDDINAVLHVKFIMRDGVVFRQPD